MADLDKLSAAFRENPRSMVFVPLATAYLEAARARDAVAVLSQGLQHHPEHTEGRFALGRAYAMLSAWREAQNELVKVVKQDRYHQRAYRLLGEVLLQRGNRDMAVKSLQRAQELDPTDEGTRQLLEGAELDEPTNPAVPEPIPVVATAPAPAAPPPPAPGLRPARDDEPTPLVVARTGARADSTEAFLNEVLESGQPLAEEPPAFVDDGAPIQPWGQRIKHPYLMLWLILLVATSAGTAWYLYNKNKTMAAIAGHLNRARAGLMAASPADLATAERESTQAIALDASRVDGLATLAASRSLAFLIYGAGKLDDVTASVVAARQRMKIVVDPRPGRRELVIAELATSLALLDRGRAVEGEATRQATLLTLELSAHPDDPVLRYLDGLARLASGDRAGARAALTQASTAGFTAARVALADLDLDESRFDDALAGYHDVLARNAQQPLALAGQALALAESNQDTASALAALEPSLGRVDGKRAEAWGRLALSTLSRRAGQAERAEDELEAAIATGLGEARFLARVAAAQIAAGNIQGAYQTRTRARGHSADALLSLVDAELYLAGGRPEQALTALGAAVAPRAHLLRGRALLDEGNPAGARGELAAGGAPEATLYAEYARVLADPGAGLDGLAKPAGGGDALANALLGEARLARGDSGGARKALAVALDAPAVAYRASTRLAELALGEKKLDDAERLARDALSQSPGYLPAHAALGKTLAAAAHPGDALPELQLVLDSGRARADDELAYAGAAAALGQADAAKAALQRAADKGAPPASLLSVAAQIDPALAAELQKKVKPAPPPRRGRHR